MLMFLSIIFFLAAFIFWVFLFIGLIKPSFVKMQSRKDVFKTFFIAGTFCFFVFALMVPSTSDDNKDENSGNQTVANIDNSPVKPAEPVKSSVPVAEEVKPPKELPMTYTEFVKRYNTAIKNLSGENTIKVKEKSDNGEFLSIQFSTKSKHIGIVADANNKTNVLKSIIFIGTGDGTLQSGINILVGMTALVMAIEDPSMPIALRKTIVEDMGFTENRLSESGKIEFVRKGVKYIATQSENMGTWLTALPSSDNETVANISEKPTKEWYEGATLHKATFKEWKSATDQNRLATAADFLAATTWKDALKKPSDFDKLKIKAAVLVKGINESVPEGSEFMKVHEIAAALVTLSNDLGPDK